MSVSVNGTNGITFNDSSIQNTAATGFGFKNRIINGACVIDQRNAGASVTIPASTVTYTLDRWLGFGSQASKFSMQQNAGSLSAANRPAGFTNYLGMTSLSAYLSLAADAFLVNHYIEGFNCADLGFGTANAQSITLSFWVRSSLTGTFSISFSNSAANRIYVATYTISSANTWEQKTITIAGDTSGAWAVDNSTGLMVRFDLGSGSNFQGAAGAWGTSNITRTSGSQSVVGTNGATFYITGVQLEKGSTATSFDYRPYGTELTLCQRYFEKSYLDGTAVGTFSAGDTNSVRFDPPVTSQTVMVGINFAARKRASPTMTAYDAAFTAGKTSYFISSWNNNGSTGAWNPYQSGATIALLGVTSAIAFSFAWIASSEL